MRVLQQPGPVHPVRIESFATRAEALSFTASAGETVHSAIASRLAARGWQSGTVELEGATLSPFQYVRPAPSPDDAHVAWYSATYAPAGITRLERANLTFGWDGERPFLHCHAVWTEPDGARRGGHILPHETVLASDVAVRAWGFAAIRIAVRPDPETGFSLLQPSAPPTLAPPALAPPSSGSTVSGSTASGGTLSDGVVARVRPNQDLVQAVEAIARTHGIADAKVVGGLGSLVGARFAERSRVDDHATEVLIRRGVVRGGAVELDLLVVDMQGRVHEGRAVPGNNAVLITFDVFLVREA